MRSKRHVNPVTLRALGAVCLACILLPALDGCGTEQATVEVTDAIKADALGHVAAGEMPDYHDWNMVETSDGIRFATLAPGTGRRAWYDDEVRVHYYVWLTDGTLVDSSRPGGVVTPFDFTVGEGRVIAGWEKIVQEMNEGCEVLTVIPWELAYGRRGRGSVPGRADLVFYIKLLRIS